MDWPILRVPGWAFEPGLYELLLLVGGIIGGAVDASSGALNDLKPNPLMVVLRTPAEEAAARAAAPAPTPAGADK